jgi:Tfp pilus assembly protein PilO
MITSGLFYFLYYQPQTQKIQQKEMELANMQNMQNILNAKNRKIVELKQDLSKLEKQVSELSPLFHSKNEVEQLFQLISMQAMENNLLISSIKKEKEKIIYMPQSPEDVKEKRAKKISHTIVPLSFSISGDYINFMNFKSFLSKGNKIINYTKENIEKGKQGGSVSVDATIHTYRIPDIKTHTSKEQL